MMRSARGIAPLAEEDQRSPVGGPGQVLDRTNQGAFGCPVLSDPDVMLCAMSVTVRIDGLDQLLYQQLCVVSRGQLLDLGMKDTAMQWRVRAGGPWQVLLPGVYLGLTGAPSLLQKGMAALLYAGPGSLITGPAALMHHGLRHPVELEMVDVLVPGGRQRVSTGFARLHRTYRMPSQVLMRGPLRLVVAARAVADTARLLTELREVRAVVADAVQRDRCTVRDLARELRDGPVRGRRCSARSSGRWPKVSGRPPRAICATLSGPPGCRCRCSTRRSTSGTPSWPDRTPGGPRPGSARKWTRTNGTCRQRTPTGPGCAMI